MKGGHYHLGFIPRPNRKFSTTIYQAAGDADATFYVNAVPSNVPCILLIEPGTDKEEKVKCTAKSTNTITVTRGYGGTTATNHSLGSTIVDYNAVEYVTEIADVLDANFNSSNVLVTTDAQLTTPKVTTSINDTNGNEVIKTPATAAAVNEVTITNAATGDAPQIAATGGDTDIDLAIKGKGSGSVKLGTADLKFPNSDGTTGQFLKTDGLGTLSFDDVGAGTNPKFSVHRNGSGQTLTNGVATKVQWTTEEYDTNNNFDNATNYRFTPTVAGKYLLQGQLYAAVNFDASLLAAHIYKNGSEYKRCETRTSGTGGDGVHFSVIVTANGSTDYFELFGYQDSGADRTLDGSSLRTWFQGTKLPDD